MNPELRESRKIVITLASEHGAGKTTTLDKLRERLPHMRPILVGAKFREEAKRRGMDAEALAKFRNANKAEGEKLDRMLDEAQEREIRDDGSAIVDSNLGALFAEKVKRDDPDMIVIKVMLTCPLEVRAKRIFEKHRFGDKPFKSIADAAASIADRDNLDHDQYMRIYKHNMHDHKHYDLVLDTSEHDPEAVVEHILKTLRAKRAKK